MASTNSFEMALKGMVRNIIQEELSDDRIKAKVEKCMVDFLNGPQFKSKVQEVLMEAFTPKDIPPIKTTHENAYTPNEGILFNPHPVLPKSNIAPELHSFKASTSKRKFSKLPVPLSKILEDLLKQGTITTINSEILSAGENHGRFCAYHLNKGSHNTDDCFKLKHKVQDLIDSGILPDPERFTSYDP